MFDVESLLKEKYIELNLNKLESDLGYEFSDKLLLVKSITHPSLKQQYAFKEYLIKQKYDFEKLEFLGDSVLSLAVIDLLLLIYPKAPHGVLAKFKNHLVSKSVVSLVASEINLCNFWLISEGEKKSGGQSNLKNFENTLESLIGAIYIDSADMKISSVIIQKLWLKHVHEVKDLDLDPKGSLQELSCLMNLGAPKYNVISLNKNEQNYLFTVRVSLQDHIFQEGCGKSKKMAEVDAAKKLLLLLSSNHH